MKVSGHFDHFNINVTNLRYFANWTVVPPEVNEK